MDAYSWTNGCSETPGYPRIGLGKYEQNNSYTRIWQVVYKWWDFSQQYTTPTIMKPLLWVDFSTYRLCFQTHLLCNVTSRHSLAKAQKGLDWSASMFSKKIDTRKMNRIYDVVVSDKIQASMCRLNKQAGPVCGQAFGQSRYHAFIDLLHSLQDPSTSRL